MAENHEYFLFFLEKYNFHQKSMIDLPTFGTERGEEPASELVRGACDSDSSEGLLRPPAGKGLRIGFGNS